MWLKAVDLCLEKLRADGLDFSRVQSLSGCAQQHGSVWWRTNSSNLLENINPDDYLHESLVSAFSLRNSPVWMDSSTQVECKLLEQHVGGASKMAQITGSRAYERFTAAQICKIYRNKRQVYDATECIQLISNFLASLFVGRYAPFDVVDASGMNLLDLSTKKWSKLCLEAVVCSTDAQQVDGLRKRLGGGGNSVESLGDNDYIIDTHAPVGKISQYFVQRYGFSDKCLVCPFTGDNPASLAGLCINSDELFLSLGTSDAACFWSSERATSVNGHLLVNAINTNDYMGLYGLKNGSKTRERLRDSCAGGSWDKFSQLLNSVPRGNFGNIGFYFDLLEIYPLAKGDFRFNKNNQRVASFAPEVEIRACLESQFMRLYYHVQELGCNLGQLKRVLVTGGASSNRDILQVIADIFRLPIYSLEIPNSACLGAAYLAKYIDELQNHEHSQPACFKDIVSRHNLREKSLLKMADPTPIASSIDVYESLVKRCIELEQTVATFVGSIANKATRQTATATANCRQPNK